MDAWLTLITLLMVVLASAMAVVRENAGDPLYLTPLINSGKMQDAKEKSVVHASWSGRVRSHAGYMTVDETYGSNLFFWFFPAKNESSPLFLWLNGGPGHPSTIGAMLENGPFALSEYANGAPRVTMRKTSWVEKFHMLYIDSPVGTGYSFTRDPAGEAKTMDDIVPNLYNVMIQFYQMFSEYQSNDLYIGGQSYAGKYIPALGKYIHDRNQDSPQIHLPMRGVYIGAGLCDPEKMFPEFPEALYYAGLISNKSRHDLSVDIDGMIQRSIASGKTSQKDLDLVVVGSLNSSENGDVSNILGLKAMVSQYQDVLNDFMNSPTTRQALHVGNANVRPYEFLNLTVFYGFIELDLFVNTNKENVFLMENYKVLHYTGNLDQVVGVAMTEAFLNGLEDWSGRDWYRQHYNTQWWSQDDTTLMGWYAKFGNFVRVIVRNAGHHVPYSQPEAALQMMTNFVFDLPFRGRPEHK